MMLFFVQFENEPVGINLCRVVLINKHILYMIYILYVKIQILRVASVFSLGKKN